MIYKILFECGNDYSLKILWLCIQFLYNDANHRKLLKRANKHLTDKADRCKQANQNFE